MLIANSARNTYPVTDNPCHAYTTPAIPDITIYLIMRNARDCPRMTMYFSFSYTSLKAMIVLLCCRAWIRTKINGFKGRCPTIGRPDNIKNDNRNNAVNQSGLFQHAPHNGVFASVKFKDGNSPYAEFSCERNFVCNRLCIAP